jgi:hypothetical protein
VLVLLDNHYLYSRNPLLHLGIVEAIQTGGQVGQEAWGSPNKSLAACIILSLSWKPCTR